MKKKVLPLFLAGAMLFACVACETTGQGEYVDPREQLATPQNVDISANGLITWNKVEHAESYLVTVGTDESSTSQLMYQVDSNALLDNFTYSVVAQAEDYRDSAPATRTYTAPEVTVSVSIDGSLRSGGTATAKAAVTGAVNKNVTWSVVSGGEYVSVDKDGKLTAKTVTKNQTAVIRATSVAKPTKYGEREVTVLAKANLTQAMIDEIAAEQTVEFYSALNIDLYTIGSRETYAGTETAAAQTIMDGEYWYTSYFDPNTNHQRELHYKNKDNIANQVAIGFNNDEIFYPVTDDLGDEISWEESGFYNSFDAFTLGNFTFDEDAWLWKYTGADKTVAERLVAAANPYSFTVKDLYLLINDDEITGIQATSEDDYSMAAGYIARMTLQSTINLGDTVSVPKLEKFESDGEYHPRLEQAIANMHELENYTVEFCVQTVNVMIGNITTLTGYDLYITEDVRYYQDFNFSFGKNNNIIKEYTGAEYGYKKLGDNFYNSFELHSEYTDESQTEYTSGFVARHAYQADFAETKPSFAFAAEIFDSPIPELGGSGVTYYATYAAMWPVATTFYKGYDHNDEMYGIFSTALAIGSNSYFVPYVTVETVGGKDYITEAAFAYNMGDYMYGVINLSYSDFNETELPEPPVELTFTTRQIPTSWADGFVVWEDDRDDLNFLEYVKDYFGDGVEIPFFNEVLGDNFGFASKTVWEASAGSDKTRFVFGLYYDVPLDMNYTIESSMRAVSKFLIEEGYTRTSAYRFTNGTLDIAIVDKDLDLFIYIWKTV